MKRCRQSSAPPGGANAGDDTGAPPPKRRREAIAHPGRSSPSSCHDHASLNCRCAHVRTTSSKPASPPSSTHDTPPLPKHYGSHHVMNSPLLVTAPTTPPIRIRLRGQSPVDDLQFPNTAFVFGENVFEKNEIVIAYYENIYRNDMRIHEYGEDIARQFPPGHTPSPARRQNQKARDETDARLQAAVEESEVDDDDEHGDEPAEPLEQEPDRCEGEEIG